MKSWISYDILLFHWKMPLTLWTLTFPFVRNGWCLRPNKAKHEDCGLDTMRSAFWSNDRAWFFTPLFWSRSVLPVGNCSQHLNIKTFQESKHVLHKKKMLWWDVAFFSCFWHCCLLPDCFLRPIWCRFEKAFHEMLGKKHPKTPVEPCTSGTKKKEWNWRPFKKSTKNLV